ncbi:MAG TPA: prolipoprotein diacylglyceryl transferase [Candidatus Acidoferrum sp.]|nr:prolipoprotein diacylglyceryl transferase [Candidatus Acidoferrum sp.]
MLPYLHFGVFSLPTYGLFLATAIACSAWLAISRAPSYGIEKEFAVRVTAYTVLAGVLACRLGDFVIHPALYWHSPQALLRSGGTFLFGFLVASLVVAGFGIRYRISAWTMGDCGAPSFALGIAIGRLGCFAAGCDYGKPSHLPWSVTFTNPVAAQIGGVPLGIPLHPSQLYESFYELCVFLLLMYLSRKPRRPGFLIWTFALCYSTGRFFLEFLRGDLDRGFWGPLSTSQWLSAFLLVLFLLLYQLPATHGAAASVKTPQIPPHRLLPNTKI